MDSSGERGPETKTTAEDRRRLLAVGRADPFLVTKLPQNGVVSKGIVQLEGGGILGFAHQPLPEGTRVRVAYQEWLYAERLPEQRVPGRDVPVEEGVSEKSVAEKGAAGENVAGENVAGENVAEKGAAEGSASGESVAAESGSEKGGARDGLPGESVRQGRASHETARLERNLEKSAEVVPAESVSVKRTVVGGLASAGVAEISTQPPNEADSAHTAEDRAASSEDTLPATDARHASPGDASSSHASPGDASPGRASSSVAAPSVAAPSVAAPSDAAFSDAASSDASISDASVGHASSNDAFPDDLARGGREVPTVGEDGERRSWTDAFGTISGGGFDRES